MVIFFLIELKLIKQFYNTVFEKLALQLYLFN